MELCANQDTALSSTSHLFQPRAIFTYCRLCQVHRIADHPVPQDLKAEDSHFSTLSSYAAHSEAKGTSCLLMPKGWLNPLHGPTQMGVV